MLQIHGIRHQTPVSVTCAWSRETARIAAVSQQERITKYERVLTRAVFGARAPIGERTQTMACNRPGKTCTWVNGDEWVNGAGTEQWKVAYDKKIYWRSNPGAQPEKIAGEVDCMRYNTSTNKINVILDDGRLFERTYSSSWRHLGDNHSCAR